MTAEERIIQLEAENAALRAEVVATQEWMAKLMERLKAQEDQRAKDSHNNSKPPSSDGPIRKRHQQCTPGGKKR